MSDAFTAQVTNARPDLAFRPRRDSDVANGVPACVIESALRVLLHSRNSHGRLRSRIRALIRADLAALRAMA